MGFNGDTLYPNTADLITLLFQENTSTLEALLLILEQHYTYLTMVTEWMTFS